MKKYWYILIFISFKTFASNKYYFSTSGSDGNSCSISLPCQTLTKLNSLSLSNGDSVFLNRGNSFYGSITVNSSGVYIGDYGTGARPIVTGFTTLSGWSSLGGGIYSTVCSGCKATDNLLLMNGVQQPLARYPNTGYLSYETFSTNTSITDNQLTGTPNWTGGYVAMKNNQYTMTTNPITNHSTTTITYTPTTAFTGSNNFGYFIINDSLALDTLGEWWFSVPTGNMKMYFGGNSPASYTIQTTTQDTLLNINTNLKNITINNLDLEGAGIYGVFVAKDTNLIISNCTIKYCGETAIWDSSGYNSHFINNYIQYCNDIGIFTGGHASGDYIGYDTIRNCGTISGQGRGFQGSNYMCVFGTSLKGIIEYCRVDTSGYTALHVYNDSSVNNNSVDYFCFLLQDGGGIYHLGYTDTTLVHNIYNNVITNGIGASSGTNSATKFANGIYVDANNFGVRVVGNTIYNCVNAGIYFHDSRSCSASSNTSYANKYQLLFQGDNASYPIKNMSIKNNIFGISASNQDLIHFDAFNSQRFNNSFGICDSNYYSLIGITNTPFYSGLSQTYNQWKDSTSDSHSNLLAASTSFQYNNTSSSLSVTLTKNYIDVLNTLYFKNINIPSFSSLLLLPGSFIVTPIGSKFSLQ